MHRKNDLATELKCKKLVGSEKVDRLYHALAKAREKQIRDFFSDKNISDRVTYGKEVTAIPPSGFSHVTFYYKGNQPPD